MYDMKLPKIGETLVALGNEFPITKVTKDGLVSIFLGGDEPTYIDYFIDELRWNESPGCWVVITDEKV